MIRLAKPEDKSEITDLWEICFGDEEEYIKLYLYYLYEDKNVLVCEEDKKIVAMTHCLPGKIFLSNQEYTVRYLFAVATLPEFRNRGYSRNLLNAAFEMALQEGAAGCVLVPQDEELFSFYKKNGYEIFSRITEKEFSWEEISHFSGETAKLSPLSLGELKKLREEYFKEKGAVLWGSEHLSFALAEADYLGGGGFLIEIDGKYGYGIAHRSEEVLYIKEMALPKGKLMPVMKAVMEKYHVQSYQVRLCENSDTTEFLTRDFSMARFDPAFYIKEKGFYLNLVLD